MSLLAGRRVVFRLATACVAGFVVLPSGVGLAQTADPTVVVKAVSGEVIELLKATPGAGLQAGIRKVLETSFDLPFMGRSALGTHWDGASPDQRARFLNATAAAEAKAYSERFSQYGGETLSIGRISERPNGVSMVESKLNLTKGQPIKIEWEVRDTGQGQRITDVKIEGVSMVMTRRSDFNAYIQKNGGKVESLIEELESRAKR